MNASEFGSLLPIELKKKKHFFGNSKVPITKSAEILLAALNDSADAAVAFLPVVVGLFCQQVFDPNFFLLFEPDFHAILFPQQQNDTTTTNSNNSNNSINSNHFNAPFLCRYFLTPDHLSEMMRFYRPILYHELDKRNVMSLYDEVRSDLKKKKSPRANNDTKSGMTEAADLEKQQQEERRYFKRRLYRAWARDAFRIFFDIMSEFESDFRSNNVNTTEGLLPFKGKWEVETDEEQRLNEIRAFMSHPTGAQ